MTAYRSRGREIADLLNDLRLINLAQFALTNDLLSILEDYFVLKDIDSDVEGAKREGEEIRVLLPCPCLFTTFTTTPVTSGEEILSPHSSVDDDDALCQAFTEGLSARITPTTKQSDALGEVVKRLCNYKSGSQPCYAQFPADVVLQLGNSYMEMSRDEHDIAVVSQLSAGMGHSGQAKHAGKTSERKKLEKKFTFAWRSDLQPFLDIVTQYESR